MMSGLLHYFSFIIKKIDGIRTEMGLMNENCLKNSFLYIYNFIINIYCIIIYRFNFIILLLLITALILDYIF